MKKLLIMFLFGLMCLTAFAQYPNDWKMPTTTYNLVGNNSNTVTTNLVNDYVGGCCTNCTYNVQPSLTFTILFTRISGTVNPTITVSTSNNGAEYVIWNGTTGTLANNLTSAPSTYSVTGCPSGSVTGMSGFITIKASATSNASYTITLTSVAQSSCYYGTGSSNATSSTLNITTP